MEMMVWLVAGSFLGWAGYSFMQLNRDRGLIVSIVIGAAGGMLGGKVVAPMLVATGESASTFSGDALLCAALIAAACVAASSFVHQRWGV